MTSITIEIPDQQAAELSVRAAEHGLTLEAWVQKLAVLEPVDDNDTAGTIDWSQCSAVGSIPGKVSGAWVLKDTRMPVATIFENLEAGANIDDILEWIGGLEREPVQEVIEFAARSLKKRATFAP
jgi:uncharacterized protein (DUF433 family)